MAEAGGGGVMRPGRGSGVAPLIYTATSHQPPSLSIYRQPGALIIYSPIMQVFCHNTLKKRVLILTAFNFSEPVFNWLCAHLALLCQIYDLCPLRSSKVVPFCQTSICFDIWLLHTCVSYLVETKRQCQAESSPGPLLATLLTSSSSMR